MTDLAAKAVRALDDTALPQMRAADTLCKKEQEHIAQIAFGGIRSDSAGKGDGIVADVNLQRRLHCL